MGSILEYITEIIIALLAFLGTMGGAYAANRKSAALMAYKLEQLEKKVDKHNQVIERVYKLETDRDVFDEKIRVANHRIDDLEHRGN